MLITKKILYLACLITLCSFTSETYTSNGTDNDIRNSQYQALLKKQKEMRKRIGQEFEKAQRAIMKYDADERALLLKNKIVTASSEGNLRKLRTLIGQNKSDINASDSTNLNWSPLTVAAYNGQWALIYALIHKLGFPSEMNIEIDRLAGPEELSALGYATQNNHHEIVEVLLRAGANPNIPEELPPLIDSIAENHDKITNMLLNFGANVNLQPSGNKTALMYALENGNIPIVERLIDLGAQLDVKDENNKTAYDYAEEANLTEKLIEIIKSTNSKKQSPTINNAKEEPFFKVL